MQIFSNILGLKIEVISDPQEATGRGGFIIAGVSLKWYKDYREAIRHVVKVEKTITPQEEYRQLYGELYEVFKESYRSLEKIFEKISRFQEKYRQKLK